MIGLFKAIRDFREDRDSSFYNFAHICIERQLTSALRSSNRKKHGPLNNYISFDRKEDNGGITLEETISLEGADPEEQVLEMEKLEELRSGIDKRLSKMEKEVLDYYLEGSNYTQIAEIMDKSPKSIDNALQRIRKKIKTIPT